MKRKLGPLVVWAVLSAGCDKPPEPSHLVSWYLDHDDERQAKITWCADNAERQRSIDCQNAKQAQGRKAMGSQATLKPIDWGAPDTKP